MRAEPTGFSARLDIRVKGIGIKDEAIIFALFVLSSWKREVPLSESGTAKCQLRRTGPSAKNRDMQ